jgi:hypothetical protein
MEDEFVRELDADALALFARKGWEAGAGAPQTGEANGVKVRRIMQLTRDLARRPFDTLRILDLGCGEGGTPWRQAYAAPAWWRSMPALCA